MIKVGLKGRFRLEVREAGTNNLKRVREFDNLITNRGLDGYGYGYGTISGCCVGTGTNTPTVNDTILGNQLAVTGSASYSYKKSVKNDNDVWVSEANIRYRFDVGKATGNLTEVGICNGKAVTANDYVLWSRALILNEENEPTALPVLENEYLDVYYTLYMYPDLTDGSFTFSIDGEEYQCTSRIAWVQYSACRISDRYGPDLVVEKTAINNIYAGDDCKLGTIEQGIQDSTKNSGIDSVWWPNVGDWIDYIPGTYYRDNYWDFKLDQCNLEGGIRAMVIGPRTASDRQPGRCLFNQTQVLLDHPIPKTQWNSIRITLRQSWGRYED